MVDFLLEHNATSNATNCKGVTPLNNAARYGRSSAIRMLLKHGAGADARDDVGNSPLHLLQGSDVDDGIIATLLQFQADVNGVTPKNRTPLNEAILMEDGATIKLLLKHGANANSMDSIGYTPLLCVDAVTWLKICYNPMQMSTS